MTEVNAETEVVKLSYSKPSIAVVALEAQASHNTFLQNLIQELQKAFKTIEYNKEVKVVVVHGYDNYFCCGGTQEELLNIQSGKLTFTDLDFYRLLLDCEVPTVAAMQGKELADKPRTSLITLKQHLTKAIKEQLPEIIEQELEMHRITFAEPEVKNRIETMFEIK